MKSEIFLCSCHGEGISVEKLDENEIDISLWCRGTRPRMGLKDRLRYIWQVITTGYAFADEIIITDETAQQLGQYLLAIAKVHSSGLSANYEDTTMKFYKVCWNCGTLVESTDCLCYKCGEGNA